jgi:ribonucleoside-diphosphate reductase alpha chain
MDCILGRNHEAGLTLKAGCGIGYEFSTLRPKGAFVAGAGATTSGPLSFMDIFDRTCFTVSSAGGRRGAQMATFDVRHPDVEDFIKAKRESGRLRQFNLSLLITDDFIEAVKNDGDWHLRFPVTKSEVEKRKFDIEDAFWDDWHVKSPNYIYHDDGRVAMKVYRTLKARRLWNLIMNSTYDFAEPGFILIDRVNDLNNNWFCEDIRATNPCGEQPLPPFGACLLGSINLTKFVENAFTKDASFNWDQFVWVVHTFSRMLDNVVELNGLPLEEQRAEILRKRRHGMGFIGLGSACTMLTLRYGSNEAADFAEKVAKVMATESLEAGMNLALEKGPAPVMNEQFTVTAEMLRKRPEMEKDGYKEGDVVFGQVLWAKYSRYLQRFPVELRQQLSEVGCRYTHATSIAPTGTIALSVCNNASNGIEPSFSHHYSRNIITEGKKTKQKVDVFSYELLRYRELVNPKAMPFSDSEDEKLPDYFVGTDDLTPGEHVAMQAAVQYWVDSSISKTVNVPTAISFQDFENVYLDAYTEGLKGCTTFRFNPEVFAGVLVKEKDLSETTYVFTLADGQAIEVKGNEEVEYEGEKHNAANLYDALTDGYYGRL